MNKIYDNSGKLKFLKRHPGNTFNIVLRIEILQRNHETRHIKAKKSRLSPALQSLCYLSVRNRVTVYFLFNGNEDYDTVPVI